MNLRRSISKPYRIAGYLAIWPALYALGVFVIVAELLKNTFPNPSSIIYILLCGHSCYLLDRVKLADHRQDPADALALPDRAMLFARHAKPIRVFVLFELLASSIVGWMIHPLLAAIPIAALIVVHAYAGRGATPKAPRLKDLPALKAFMIASGHMALSLVVLWALDPALPKNLHWDSAIAIIGVWLIIVSDAVLCDIDDHETDRVYSTQSLAVLLGPRRAWVAAFGFIAIGSIMIAIEMHSMIWISAALVISTLITMKNTNHRDLVDARLLPIVLIGIWLLN